MVAAPTLSKEDGKMTDSRSRNYEKSTAVQTNTVEKDTDARFAATVNKMLGSPPNPRVKGEKADAANVRPSSSLDH